MKPRPAQRMNGDPIPPAGNTRKQDKRKEKTMEKSIIIGIMLQHADGGKEYYSPVLTEEDTAAIYSILEKYGDDNESKRGNLEIIERD